PTVSMYTFFLGGDGSAIRRLRASGKLGRKAPRRATRRTPRAEREGLWTFRERASPAWRGGRLKKYSKQLTAGLGTPPGPGWCPDFESGAFRGERAQSRVSSVATEERSRRRPGK